MSTLVSFHSYQANGQTEETEYGKEEVLRVCHEMEIKPYKSKIEFNGLDEYE